MGKRRILAAMAVTAVSATVAVVGATVAAAGGANGVNAATSPSRAVTHSPSRAATRVPMVGASAFAGQGKLAFVSAGRLYVLDGSAAGQAATLHSVAAPAGVVAPAFSPDGRWLAFLVTPASSYPEVSGYVGTLWLARADGSAARPVLGNAGAFAWSPADDVLAATVYPPSGTSSATLYELGPGMAPRLVPGASGPAAWSPDGRELAFAAMSGRPPGGFTGLLETMPARGGTPEVRYRSPGNALDLAGWWPDGDGLLTWIDEQSSASLAADGLPLESVPLNPGALTSGVPTSGRAASLGLTLVYPAFVSVNAGAGVAAISAGGDRYEWDAKNILVCQFTGGCAGLPAGSPGATNTDPALSPGGRYLAFVHGAASSPTDFSQVPVSQWYATRSLWLATLASGPPTSSRSASGPSAASPPTSGSVRQLTAAGTSVADPTWSANGQRLLYVRDNGLWLLDPAGGVPARIVASLFSGPWPNYFYYIDWPDQFAWHS
jgi:Tol biopolymer transport system component